MLRQFLPARPGLAELVAVAGALGRGAQRQFDLGQLARGRRAAGFDRRGAVAEGEQRERIFVHPVRADQRAERGVREQRADPGRQSGAVRCRRQLGQHRARVPVEVAPAAFGVPPAGAPRHAGHDQGGGRAAGRGADRDEGVLLGVVPVHAVRDARDAARARVELQREPGAGRAGRPEQDPSPAALGRAHHPGAEEEHPAELRGVQRQRRRRRAGQDGRRARAGIAQVTG